MKVYQLQAIFDLGVATPLRKRSTTLFRSRAAATRRIEPMRREIRRMLKDEDLEIAIEILSLDLLDD